MSQQPPRDAHGKAAHPAHHGREIHDLPEGFRQLLGYRLEEWREDHCRLRLTIGPKHLNRCGIVHAGLLAALLEAAGGYAGCYCPHRGRSRRVVTLALKTEFLVPVTQGTLYAIGEARSGGDGTVAATTEVRDEQDRLIARGEGTYRYRDGCESAEGLPIETHHETRTTGLG